MINLNAGERGSGVDTCGQEAAYMAWMTGCNICWLMDFPRCVGHPVCVQHGAELRARPMPDRSEMNDLERISSL